MDRNTGYKSINGFHNSGVNNLGTVWAVNHDGTVDFYKGKSAFSEIAKDSAELAKTVELYSV
jgi:hypothetical protein